MTIHRAGYATLSYSLILFTILNAFTYFYLSQFWYVSVLIFTALVYASLLNFFRSPKFSVIENPKHIIAPANGTVVVIEEAYEDEYFDAKRLQVSIFMSPLDVHINRAPIEGDVSYECYHKGKYLVAFDPKSSKLNERNTIVFRQTESKLEVLCRQIAGALARRIECYVEKDQKIKQGEEFGFIKFGSRVDVFLPLDAKVRVSLKETVKGGRTVLAEI